MSALAEQIAREHLALLNTSTWLIVGCTCDPTLTAPPSGAAGSWYAAHIATVTERAVRKRVAAEIEREADLDMEASGERLPAGDRLSTPVSRRLRRIARDVARGGTP